ncbi:MAG: hypothetical protein HPZ91_04285 [Lentisphaeria bacterium]|nr:hypothetical protein [Lentisphaeria bacterium]
MNAISGLEVHDFTADHLEGAGAIALQQWGDEIPEMPEKMCRRIYHYLVRYYCVPDSPFSIGASADGKLCAFLLAAPAAHVGSEAADEWMAGQLESDDEYAFYREYKAYIDGNRQKELRHAAADEAVLLLFASVRRGAGRMLMAEFERRCRRHGVSSMLLWTDETCDFDYYYRNGFSETAKFPTEPTICGRALTTYLFRKTIA